MQDPTEKHEGDVGILNKYKYKWIKKIARKGLGSHLWYQHITDMHMVTYHSYNDSLVIHWVMPQLEVLCFSNKIIPTRGTIHFFNVFSFIILMPKYGGVKKPPRVVIQYMCILLFNTACINWLTHFATVHWHGDTIVHFYHEAEVLRQAIQTR